MAGKVIKKAWFKEHPVITAIICFFIFIILLGAFSPNDKSSNNNSPSENQQSNPDSKVPVTTDFCRSLIPSRIDLGTFTISNGDRYWSNRDSYSKLLVNETLVWNDGTPIEPQIRISFSQGRNAGENINLAYSDGLSYSKTPVSSDGTIGKEISYRMILVLDPNDKNADGYKIVSYKCCQNDVGVSYCRANDAPLNNL